MRKFPMKTIVRANDLCSSRLWSNIVTFSFFKIALNNNNNNKTNV